MLQVLNVRICIVMVATSFSPHTYLNFDYVAKKENMQIKVKDEFNFSIIYFIHSISMDIELNIVIVNYFGCSNHVVEIFLH